MHPTEHPRWALKDWVWYWIYFPIEWTLTFAMCVLGWCLALYGWVQLTRNARTNPGLLDTSKQRSVDGMSIVIPCYNEGKSIQSCLRCINKNLKQKSNVEIIIVDGGSKDGTLDKVKEIENEIDVPVKTYFEKGVTGRGVCQNVGAKHARYNVLFFLHADTILEYGFDTKVIKSSQNPKTIVGAFTFGVDRSIMVRPLVGLGTMEYFARVRNNMYWLPYGDQTLWCHREMFEKLGRFPNTPFMEDFELVRRARQFAVQTAGKIHIDDTVAYCSPRRWEKNGVAYNTLWNQIVVFSYSVLHYSPDEIYRMYYGYSV